MRYAQSFETSKQKQERAAKWGIKERKHSPSFDNVTWDKEKVLQALQNWPTNETINWTKFAGDCGIPGRNRGQIAKEFAKENGLDTIKLDSRQPNQRMRAKLFKLPGGGVSVPTHQSTEANKQDWAKMIAEGELTLGEPCAPHTLTKLAIVNGELKTKQETVYGRKIPLKLLREKLLQKHRAYMRLHSDSELFSMNKEQLLECYKDWNIQLPEETSLENLQQNLAECERTRTLAVWHDHATVAGKGYISYICTHHNESSVRRSCVPRLHPRQLKPKHSRNH